MIRKSLIYIFALMLITGTISAEDNNCLTCHADFEDDDGPSHLISKDIHFQKGLGCVACHGGDETLEDMDEVREVKSYRGVPSHNEVPQFCAGCHSDAAYMHEHNPSLPTDQLAKYKTSVHGQQLFGKKDSKVANCISCHTVHMISNASLPFSSTHPLNIPTTCGKCHSNDEYMGEYSLETNIVADYSVSVHGQALLERGDLGAPACNDCHGNHGAAPPGVNSLSAVCGTCHAIEADLFDDSPHKVAYEENDFPMCATCHSNHKIEKPQDTWVGSGESSVCAECHATDDGTTAMETADGIARSLAKLIADHDEAKIVLEEAIQKGMMTTDDEFLLKEVDQAVIQTRTAIHAFSLDSVLPKAEAGIEKAEQVKTNSAALIDEYYFRRKGLGLATLFITMMVIGLYLKIRKIEKP